MTESELQSSSSKQEYLTISRNEFKTMSVVSQGLLSRIKKNNISFYVLKEGKPTGISVDTVKSLLDKQIIVIESNKDENTKKNVVLTKNGEILFKYIKDKLLQKNH